MHKSPAGIKGPRPATEWSRLLPAVAAGDPRALAELYDAASNVVYGFALRIVSDRELAEDVVVDVFAQVWRDAKTYDPVRGTVATWILSAVRSRAIDILRSRKRDQAAEPIESAAHVPSALPDPEATSALRERQRFVRRALEGLSVEQREVIELAYFFGLSHSEIAVRLGQPLGTIKTRIRIAMIRMRELLGHLSPPAAAGLKEGTG